MVYFVLVQEIIRPGRTFQLVFLLTIILATLLALYLSKKGKTWSIRTIEGLEATKEGIARCAEMGRPVFSYSRNQ
jgi:hypothetical protein